MNKWFGKIGFAVNKELKKGIWKPVMEEKDYEGDVISYRQSMTQQQNSTNDDMRINATISIIADDYFRTNLTTIKYAEFMGVRWKVKEITPQRPRLQILLGGVYNANSDQS